MKNGFSKKFVLEFYKYRGIRKWLTNEKNNYEHDLIIMDFAKNNIYDEHFFQMLTDIWEAKYGESYGRC